MSSLILTPGTTNLQVLSWAEMHDLLVSGGGPNITTEQVILEILRRHAVQEGKIKRHKRRRRKKK